MIMRYLPALSRPSRACKLIAGAAATFSSLVPFIFPSSASACVWPLETPPTPPPQPTKYWVFADGPGSSLIGQEVAAFDALGNNDCTCGVGLGNVSNPTTITSSDVFLAVSNMKTHAYKVIPEFETLLVDQSIVPILQGLPGSNPGSNITGFSGVVTDFTKPVLGPDEAFVLYYRVNADVSELMGKQVQFFAGSPSMPSHPVVPFSPQIDVLSADSVHVPGPLPILGAAFTFTTSRRIRKRIRLSLN